MAFIVAIPHACSKFKIQTTKTRLYIIGTAGDGTRDPQHRLIQIDRTEPHELKILEEGNLYSTSEIDAIMKNNADAYISTSISESGQLLQSRISALEIQLATRTSS